MALGLNTYLIGGGAVVVLALSGALYIEHLKVGAAHAEKAVAERDMKHWKDNFDEADRVARANAAAIDDLKARLAASSQSADEAKAAAAENIKKYQSLQAKVKEQHAPTDSSPYMRAFLDGLCQQQTGAACPHY